MKLQSKRKKCVLITHEMTQDAAVLFRHHLERPGWCAALNFCVPSWMPLRRIEHDKEHARMPLQWTKCDKVPTGRPSSTENMVTYSLGCPLSDQYVMLCTNWCPSTGENVMQCHIDCPTCQKMSWPPCAQMIK